MSDSKKALSLPVAILAGGLATRMQPLTATKPKSLISVAGDYFISHQLRYLKKQGVRKVVLCLGHFGEQIEAVVGTGEDYGLELSYSYDGPILLGTGGSIKRALPLLGESFFILYGDSYLPIDFALMANHFQNNKFKALMAVLKNNNNWDKSNVLLKENQVEVYNKNQSQEEMNYIDYGLTIISAEEVKNFHAKESFDLAELYQDLALKKKLFAYEVYERFYEIGSMQGLQDTIQYFSSFPTYTDPNLLSNSLRKS